MKTKKIVTVVKLVMLSCLLLPFQQVAAANKNNLATSSQSTPQNLERPEIKEIPPTVPGRTINQFRSQTGFAGICEDGSLISWGGQICYCDAAPELPAGVMATSIVSNFSAFTALLNNGKIICWGDLESGGNTPILPAERTVISVTSGPGMFIALLDDGTLLEWSYYSQKIKLPEGNKAVSVASNLYGFTAILLNQENKKTCFSWGLPGRVTYPDFTKPPLKDRQVNSIAATDSAFAAILDDGSIYAWGDENRGGKLPALKKHPLENKKATAIYSTKTAFTACFEDGTIFSWGNPKEGGITPDFTRPELKEKTVTSIVSTDTDFTALFNDGSLWSWGWSSGNGKLRNKSPETKTVQTLAANSFSFAVIFDDGSLLSWRTSSDKNTAPGLNGKKAESIVANGSAFTAILNDESNNRTCISWGNPGAGGNLSDFDAVPELKGKAVVSVAANYQAFTALLNDGTVYSWGNKAYGGEAPELHGRKVAWLASPFEEPIWPDAEQK